MKRLALTATIVLALSATVAPGRDRDRLRHSANPGAVVAAELGFASLAQEKGQWTAFRETATRDAVMFVPEPVNAESFLKGKANPPVAVRWQPHQVWSSCDGSLAVTYGAWQRPTGVGYFTTVWQRQKDGEYKWVMDQGDDLAEPLIAPEMISASVADCGSKQAIAAAPMTSLGVPARGSGVSRDFSLAYDWQVAQDLSRRFTVSMIKDGKMVTVLDLKVAAPAP
jgi:hypothetical protein